MAGGSEVPALAGKRQQVSMAEIAKPHLNKS
jgi:hypothetical protein